MRDRIAARGGSRDAADPHRRIESWLVDGAGEELPRDVMVHALVCSACRTQIAAFDMLTAAELDRAGAPPRIARPERGHDRAGSRLALAAGGAVAVSAAAVVAVTATGWRPTLGSQDANASTVPTQAVLGNTGEPQPTVSASPTARARPSRSAIASDGAASSTPVAPTLAPPPVTLPSPVATLRATPRPRPTATATTGTPTAIPSTPTPSPTDSATPTDTPSPAPTP
jgi:hypothetical protein